MTNDESSVARKGHAMHVCGVAANIEIRTTNPFVGGNASAEDRDNTNTVVLRRFVMDKVKPLPKKIDC